MADRLIGLAGTPDDSARVGTDLVVVAQAAAATITAVGAVSVTGRCPQGFVTVAASDDVAVIVDEAQYDQDAGPCLQALETGRPVAVGEITATAGWPAFRTVALDHGLRTSLSVPLFAGSGAIVAALNLYSRHPEAMTTLSAAICDAYDPDSPGDWDHDHLDAGSRDLIAGVIGAVALRCMIQQSLRLLAPTVADSAERAYLALCAQAARARTGLADAAAKLIEEHQPGH